MQIFEDLLNKILSTYCQDICFRNWFDQSYDCIPWKVQVITSVCFCFTGDVMLTRIHHHVTGRDLVTWTRKSVQIHLDWQVSLWHQHNHELSAESLWRSFLSNIFQLQNWSHYPYMVVKNSLNKETQQTRNMHKCPFISE